MSHTLKLGVFWIVVHTCSIVRATVDDPAILEGARPTHVDSSSEEHDPAAAMESAPEGKAVAAESSATSTGNDDAEIAEAAAEDSAVTQNDIRPPPADSFNEGRDSDATVEDAGIGLSSSCPGCRECSVDGESCDYQPCCGGYMCEAILGGYGNQCVKQQPNCVAANGVCGGPGQQTLTCCSGVCAQLYGGTEMKCPSANLRGSLTIGNSTSEGKVMSAEIVAPSNDDAADDTTAAASKVGPSQKDAMTTMMASGWGHGVPGETCCMCAKSWGYSTILYAAGDYSHMFGTHSANRYCNLVCERQCRFKGGHMFGCYDEAHLIQMDMRYGHNPQYTILHEEHFGNIC